MRRLAIARSPLALRAPGDPGSPLAPLGRHEPQRDTIDAVAQARRLGAVLEDVALVSAATRAVTFLHTVREPARFDLRLDAARDALPEARPAGAAVVLGLRLEQGQRAAGANERPSALLVVERAR